jgi:hypothetical protein
MTIRRQLQFSVVSRKHASDGRQASVADAG